MDLRINVQFSNVLVLIIVPFYILILVQLILIKWQLYVTSKKFPDKGVFPFEKGVKKWLFSLISVL